MEGSNQRNGFSLIEMIIVLLIAGILMAIIIPNFARIVRGENLRTSVETFAQEIRALRERALVRGEIFRVTTQPPRDYVIVDQNNRTVTRKIPMGSARFGTTGGVIPAPDDPAPLGFDNDTLTLDNRGAATPGAFYLNDGNENYAVGITRIGRVKIYKWGGSQWY